MRIILLSGGSGKRLWPLSNDARSKQFLKLLKAPTAPVSRCCSVWCGKSRPRVSMPPLPSQPACRRKMPSPPQLGAHVDVVTEPERRSTFPAIALAVTHLLKEKQCRRDEVVVVMPIDPYTESGYFDVIAQMAEAAEKGVADLVLMGIRPTRPSSKFGYIVPDTTRQGVAYLRVL